MRPRKTTSQELRSDIPNALSNLFGAKPQTELPLGWKGEPLSGAPDLEGMRVAETDKFAEGESHISIIETKDKQRLVAKIERSIAEGHLFAELEAYKHIYKPRANILILPMFMAWLWCHTVTVRRKHC